MTDKQLEQKVKAAIQKWAAALGISDYTYTIELCTDRKLRGNYAEVNTDDETREVTVSMNKHRLSREPNELEKTVVHELLHTRLNEYAEHAITIINEYVTSPKTKHLLGKQLERLEHKVVVALTDALTRKGD
jgi:hypothetical protein